MKVDKIIYILMREYSVTKYEDDINEEINDISVVRFIGLENGIHTEKVFSTNDFDKLIEDFCVDKKVVNQIKLLNQIKQASYFDSLPVDNQWLFSNLENVNLSSLYEKSQIYIVEVFFVNEDKSVYLSKGNYMLNTLNAIFKNRINSYFNRTSYLPIYINEEYENKTCKPKSEVIYSTTNFRLSAEIMLDILIKIMPAFMEQNIIINQSWLSINNDITSSFNPLINLTIRYPDTYIDLNGCRNKEPKYIIQNGKLCNYIGQGDGIILNEHLLVDFGYFSIDFNCEKNIHNAIKYAEVDEALSTINVDIRTGTIVTHLVGILNDKIIERDFCIGINQFFSSVITGIEKKEVDGNYISEVIINI